MDSDALVMRKDHRHDYLKDMTGLLETDSRSVTVSFNIIHDQDAPWSHQGPDGPWRMEVRAALVHLPRLREACPLPNEDAAGGLRHGWHRSADLAVRAKGLLSWRGGSAATGYIHPPNTFKRSPDEWLIIMDRVENGFVPAGQAGQAEVTAPVADWMGPKRREPFVFVITGRNVPAGRFRRCLDSVLAQRRRDWGAVVIDDASDLEIAEHGRRYCSPHSGRITFIRSRIRRGQTANLVCAIRHVCAKHPAYIPDPLYLYEPSGHARTPEREEIIGRIVAKPSMRRSEGRQP